MTGTASQIQWAEEIRPRVEAEFQRVASAFRAIEQRQHEPNRSQTGAVLAILEEKRAEVMANSQAGYFIKNWQELTDQVRRMIAADSRYISIQSARGAK